MYLRVSSTVTARTGGAPPGAPHRYDRYRAATHLVMLHVLVIYEYLIRM